MGGNAALVMTPFSMLEGHITDDIWTKFEHPKA